MSWRSFGADYFDCNDNKMAFVDTVLKTGLLHGLLDKHGEKKYSFILLFYQFKTFLFQGLYLKWLQNKT